MSEPEKKESDKIKKKQPKEGFIKLNLSWTNNFIQVFLIAILLGVLCGLIMVLFNSLLILFQINFSIIPYFLTPMLAGILTSLLVKYGHLEKILGTGSGEFIKEVHYSEDDHRMIPTLLGKTVATSWTYGSGMICGREGPGLLIGASFGALLSDKFNQDKEDCSFIGASACTAAILKAPISGALFCAELPYNNHIQYKSLLPSIIGATLAYIVFCMFFGFEPLIETQLELSTPNQSHYLSLLPLLLLFGLIVGISILFYINFLRTFTLRLRHSFKEKEILWVLPMLGGLGYGIFLLIFIPFIPKSTQVDILQPDVLLLNFLTGNIQNETLIFLLILLLFIVIAIFLSIGTLNSAGIIMPLMIFGAIMGGLFGLIFYPQQPLLFVLLGISAVLGAATNNPIAAIFIIVEMTWMPLLFIPAGITTIIAYIFSGPNSIIPHQRDIKSIKEKFMITI